MRPGSFPSSGMVPGTSSVVATGPGPGGQSGVTLDPNTGELLPLPPPPPLGCISSKHFTHSTQPIPLCPIPLYTPPIYPLTFYFTHPPSTLTPIPSTPPPLLPSGVSPLPPPPSLLTDSVISPPPSRQNPA